MTLVERLLAQVPVIEGFVRVSVVDAVTGQVLGSRRAGESGTTDDGTFAVATDDASVHEAPADSRPAHDVRWEHSALAAATTEILQVLGATIAAGALDEDLQDLVITLSGHHHLVRLLPDVAGTDLYLLLTVDRAGSNLALARHQLLAFEVPLVA